MKLSYTDRIVILFCAYLAALPMMSNDIYVVALPLLQNDFSVSKLSIQFTIILYTAGFGFSALIFSYMVSKVGVLKSLKLGVILYALSSVGIYYSKNIILMDIMRLIQGLGGGAGTILSRVIIIKYFKYEKSKKIKAFSIVASSISISPLISPFVGSYVAQNFGWRSIFGLLFILSVVLYISSDVLRKHINKSQSEPKFGITKSVEIILKSRTFYFVTFMVSITCAIEYMFIIESSFVYQEFFGLSMYSYSFIFALVLFSFVVGSYILVKMHKITLSSQILKNAVKLACVLSVAMIVASLLSGVKMTLVTLFFVCSMIIVGVIVPLTQSLISELAENVGIIALGLFFFFEFIILAIVGYLISMSEFGPKAMISGAVLCWILSALVYLLFQDRKVLNVK